MIKYTVHVYESGNRYWYLNGLLHREGGPAIEYATGSQDWLLNDLLHRDDGPAVVREDVQEWHIQGQGLHRLDGPAQEWADGLKCWFLHGREYSESEFLLQGQ